MIITCPQCGKKRDVLYPDMWAYKKSGTYYCSYTCRRAAEREEEEEKMNITKVSREQKKKAIQIALDGGDPREYLKECGSDNPQKMWTSIRNSLKKTDPETFGKLPTLRVDLNKPVVDKGMPKKKPETVEGPDGKEYEKLELDGGKNYELSVAETPETPAENPVTRPMNFGGYEVTAIRHPVFGEFHYSKKYDFIRWDMPEGGDIEMSPDEWIRFGLCIPDMLGVLGVKV